MNNNSERPGEIPEEIKQSARRKLRRHNRFLDRVGLLERLSGPPRIATVSPPVEPEKPSTPQTEPLLPVQTISVKS